MHLRWKDPSQNNIKKSTVKLSLPGDLLFFIFLKTSRTAFFREISDSDELDISGSNLHVGKSKLII